MKIAKTLLAFGFGYFHLGLNPTYGDDCASIFSKLSPGYLPRINSVTAGLPSNPKIILIHGTPGSWKNFSTQLEDKELTRRAYVIAVDRLGFGNSEGEATTIENQAKALMPLLDLGDATQPAIIVGNSYGAAVAMQMAALQDPRIRSVVVLGGIFNPDTPRVFGFQYALKKVDWCLTKNLRACNREIIELKAELEKLVPIYTQIKAGIVVIQGLKDKRVDPGNADYISGKVKAKVIRLPGIGHAIQKEDPETVRQVLIEELGIIDSP
jgi:pimeloyl-ACP methyl ester carboxylesterase